MPTLINSNYSENFQKFVDFANKAYVKFDWTTTIDVDGNAVATPIRIDRGQYEAEAMNLSNEKGEYDAA